jgi:hypothetical protein
MNSCTGVNNFATTGLGDGLAAAAFLAIKSSCGCPERTLGTGLAKLDGI